MSCMRIPGKGHFWRMSLTKSLHLVVHWTPNTYLKPPTTCTLRHKYSNFDLDDKKHALKRLNCEIIKNVIIYSVLSANHGSRTSPWDSPLGLIRGLTTSQKRSRKGFEQVSNTNCLKIRFSKDVSNEITVFALPHGPWNELGPRAKTCFWLQKRWWIGVLYEGLTKGPKKSRECRLVMPPRPGLRPIREIENRGWRAGLAL